MINVGDTLMINDTILGVIAVVVNDILGDVVSYGNDILKHSGMCHVSIFKKMIV